jgi:putative transposase
MAVLHGIIRFIPAFLGDRAELATKNMALRQRLAVLKEGTKRPRLRKRDRIFWVWLSRLWTGWRSALLIVSPTRL